MPADLAALDALGADFDQAPSLDDLAALNALGATEDQDLAADDLMATLNALGVVSIVVGASKNDPRDSLVPPPPQPTPIPTVTVTATPSPTNSSN